MGNQYQADIFLILIFLILIHIGFAKAFAKPKDLEIFYWSTLYRDEIRDIVVIITANMKSTCVIHWYGNKFLHAF